MAAASSGRAEVDTSRAFRSVKEAVAVFGDRILARETQFRPGAIAHGDRLSIREKNSRSSFVAIAAPGNAKLEFSDGVVASGSLDKGSHPKASASSYDVMQGGRGSNPAPSLLPVQVTRPEIPDDVSMYLAPSSPPFFASSPSVGNEEQEREEADLTVMSVVRKLEEEAAMTRQDVAQLKRRVAETELSMATLNAKLHRALSRLARMEADEAAAERASIERGRSGTALALAPWGEHRREPGGRPPTTSGHLVRYADADAREAAAVTGGQQETARPVGRKVRKRKPIVPLVFPLINGLLFSNERRTKDREGMYMKELYSLLRLS